MLTHKLMPLAATLTLALAANGQILCHAENDGSNYDDFAGITGAWFGIAFVAPASFAVQRLEIFTGEVSTASQLDVWSDNATLTQPFAPLGSGTFTIQTSVGWQGANMSAPIALTGGTRYWIVWHPVAGAQPSLDQPMATFGQDTCVSVDGGQSWNGPFSSMDRHWKFRVYGDCCSSYSTYCTSGTTTNGCTASVSATGAPDANAGFGFVVTANGVEGQKQGLFFYGLSGPLAQTWGIGPSILCVKPPTQRTPAQSSNGTLGFCDGTLTIDWNTYIASNPGALGNPFAGGESAWIQAWFRDPQSTKTTALSNALQFVVCP